MSNHSSEAMRRFNMLFGELDSLYHDLSLKLGVSDSVSMIMYTICSEGDSLPLSDICRNTGLSKQTVNSAIRGLERDGVICLEAVDGRAKRVCLTEKGRAFAEKTVYRIIDMENGIFEEWSEEDVKTCLDLFGRFISSFRDKVNKL